MRALGFGYVADSGSEPERIIAPATAATLGGLALGVFLLAVVWGETKNWKSRRKLRREWNF